MTLRIWRMVGFRDGSSNAGNLRGGEIVAGVESNLWNHPEVYPGVSIGVEPEMTPRLLLTRAPYAVRLKN